MKKLTKGTVLLFAVLLASIMLLSGCDTLFGEDIGEGTKRNEVFTLEDGGNISIDMLLGDIFVGISSDDKVHITYHEYDRIKYNLIQNDDGFTIKQIAANGLNSNNMKGITVLVPNHVAYDIFYIYAVDSGITIKDISVSNVNVNVVSGNIKLERVSVTENIKIDAVSGNVEGRIVGSRNDFTVLVSSISGGCYVQGGQGGSGKKQLFVSSVSGNINIAFTE